MDVDTVGSITLGIGLMIRLVSDSAFVIPGFSDSSLSLIRGDSRPSAARDVGQ